MKIGNILFFSFFLFLIFRVFHMIFSLHPLAGGDYIFFSPQNISYWAMYPFSGWDPKINLGGSSIPFLGYGFFSWLFGLTGNVVKNNIAILERIFWWSPFLVAGFFSSFFLTKKILGKTPFIFISPLIYLFNTYILLIIGGGQISGIGMAYSVAPFMLAAVLTANGVISSLVIGVVSSIIFMFDIRIWYITFLSTGLFVVFDLFYEGAFHIKKIFTTFFLILGVPLCITMLFHAQWFLPMAIFRQNPLQELGNGYTSLSAVNFFSFATFENALGLLHPNWPENIFGKVDFMKPEFLLLPLLAYSSLLFVGKKLKESKYLLFFDLLGLIGIFLAKGTHDPFGSVYLWMFGHIPGFGMFRDPTKWYLLIAISYSVLVPFTVKKVYEHLSAKKKFAIFHAHQLFLLSVIIYMLFLIRPALAGKLTGTFQVRPVPLEYKTLDKYLGDRKNFSRVLWIPTDQRFAFFSVQHPKVSAEDFFQTSQKGVLDALLQTQTQKYLQDGSIGYVIVPFDSEKEIFLKDRIYSDTLYKQTLSTVKGLDYLIPLSGFGRLAVFMLPLPKKHIWLDSNQGSVDYVWKSPTEYIVTVKNVSKGDRVVFSEKYNPFWIFQIGKKKILPSQVFEGHLNSYTLSQSGTYTMRLIYQPQKWITLGVYISIIFMSFLTLFFFFHWRSESKMVQ